MDVHYPKVKDKNQMLMIRILYKLWLYKLDGLLQIPTLLFSKYLPFSFPINYYIFINMSPSIGSAQHFIFLKKLFFKFC